MSMLNSTSDDQVNVLIKSTADTSGTEKTNKSLDELEGKSEKSGSALSALGGIAKATATGIAALAGVVGVAGAAAIKSAGEFEQNRVAFDVMLGSADKARELMVDISEFAKTTPFELPDVVAGSKKLIAYGFSQEKVIETMRRLGDVSSGVGTNMNELVDIYGKARTQGTLFTEDFDQFTGRGIPLAQALSGVLGVSADKVRGMASEGKITFAVLEKGFKKMTEDGGQFSGMMEKQSQTFEGTVSNIKDGFGQILRSAVGITVAGDIVQGGIFDRIKNAAQSTLPFIAQLAESVGPAVGAAMGKMDEAIAAVSRTVMDVYKSVSEYLGPKLSALWVTIQDRLIPTLTRLWNEVIVPLVPVIGTLFVGALGLVIDTLNVLLPILTELTNWLIDNKPLVLGIATAIGAIWVAMKAKEGIEAFMGNFNLAKTAVMGSIDAIKNEGLGGLAGKLTSFAAWGAFAALAVGAFQLIIEEGNKVKALLDSVAAKSGEATKKQQDARDAFKRGEIDANTYKQRLQEAADEASKLSNIARQNREFYSGIQGFWRFITGDKPQGFSEGGFTGRGSENDVAGIVHRGEYVIPKEYVNQSTGEPRIANNRQTTINIGQVVITNPAASQEFFNQLDNDTLLTSNGMTPVRGSAL